VDTAAETEVRIGIAANVEARRVVELGRVAVGGGEEADDQ